MARRSKTGGVGDGMGIGVGVGGGSEGWCLVEGGEKKESEDKKRSVSVCEGGVLCIILITLF